MNSKKSTIECFTKYKIKSVLVLSFILSMFRNGTSMKIMFNAFHVQKASPDRLFSTRYQLMLSSQQMLRVHSSSATLMRSKSNMRSFIARHNQRAVDSASTQHLELVRDRLGKRRRMSAFVRPDTF